jgi:hypothetical protein
MTTTIYSLPQNFIRSASWAQSDQRRNLQRSEFTGRTRETIIGPADRWTCAADIRPMRAGDIETWRAFQAQMKLPGARVRLPAVESGQRGQTALATVNGANQTGDALALSGLTPSQRNLRAGQMLTVVLPGDEQLIMLTADLLADASGNGTAQLGSPLRRSPANGATVELNLPWGLMRTTDPLGWSVDPAPIYGARQIIFEEAF